MGRNTIAALARSEARGSVLARVTGTAKSMPLKLSTLSSSFPLSPPRKRERKRERRERKAKGPSGVDSVLVWDFVFFFSLLDPLRTMETTRLSSTLPSRFHFAVALPLLRHGRHDEDDAALNVLEFQNRKKKSVPARQVSGGPFLGKEFFFEKTKKTQIFVCSSSAGLKSGKRNRPLNVKRAARCSPPPLPPERH